MVQRVPPSDFGVSAGQVVHGPAATDGIGSALRNVFKRDAELPASWQECLRRLDDLPRC